MPKTTAILTLFLLVRISLYGQVFDVQTLQDNGSTDKRINFVYMGDGYTASQQDIFLNDAQNAMNAQFNTTPYKEYHNFFNVFAIKVISNEEGVDHPGTATDVTEPVFPVGTADTYFDSTFDYYNIHRLLVPTDYTAIYDVLSANTPFYDQANIIVNTPYYGGSGGDFATASTNTQASQIMIHEIGHSFVSLADEYWAGSDYAAEKANMTQESDPAFIKWKNWLDDEDIGIYPYGSSGDPSQWYRPHQSCIMRQLGNPFCAVCREATINRIYELVNPIDAHSPENSSVDFDGTDLDFSVDLIYPEPNTLTIEWMLDGNSINTTDTQITLTNTDLGSDPHQLSVVIEDTTGLSRSYLPANGYVFSFTWNINNYLPSGENTLDKLVYQIYPNPAHSTLNLSYTSENIQGDYTLSITDMQGKLITAKKWVPQYGKHLETININNLETGIYILSIKSSHYSKRFHFIKE